MFDTVSDETSSTETYYGTAGSLEITHTYLTVRTVTGKVVGRVLEEKRFKVEVQEVERRNLILAVLNADDPTRQYWVKELLNGCDLDDLPVRLREKSKPEKDQDHD